MSNYPAHIEYQTSAANPESPLFIKKIMAGPITDESGKYMIGSHIIVEATREEVQVFVDNDPFKKENVWETITIERFVNVVKPTPSL
ncbi:unnamed protein product [Laminaria digitata]